LLRLDAVEHAALERCDEGAGCRASPDVKPVHGNHFPVLIVRNPEMAAREIAAFYIPRGLRVKAELSLEVHRCPGFAGHKGNALPAALRPHDFDRLRLRLALR